MSKNSNFGCIFLLSVLFLTGCGSAGSSVKRTTARIYNVTVIDGKEANRKLVGKHVFNEHGQVISEVQYTSEAGVHSKKEYQYDQKNRLIREQYEFRGKLEYICKAGYNAHDSVSKYVFYNPDKTLDYTTRIYYNRAGKKHKEVNMKADGSLGSWNESSYNSAGNEIKWVLYNPDSTIQARVVSEYDEKNRCIKNTYFSEFEGTYTFKYNQKNLKSEETVYDTREKQFLWLKVFSYDKQNRVVKIVEYNHPAHRPSNPAITLVYEYK